MAAQPTPAPNSQIISRHREDLTARDLWMKVLSGHFEEALYVTAMSKDSLDEVARLLLAGSKTSHHLRVLTLDPNMDGSAIAAFAKNLSEHEQAPWKAKAQVRNAAEFWEGAQARHSSFLRLKSYASTPTMQGFCVRDDFILVEILPYEVATQERPALLIKKCENEELFKLFTQSFETLWNNGSTLTVRGVDENTQYTQAYTEFRRYRDYELTAAVWFGALQIGVATTISRLPDSVVKGLGQLVPQIFLAVIILVIGISGVVSVSYTKNRQDQLSQAMVDRFGSAFNWHGMQKARLLATPYWWILAALMLLPVANTLFVRVCFGWTPAWASIGAAAVCAAAMMMGRFWGLSHGRIRRNAHQ
jgi:hypothetical protein